MRESSGNHLTAAHAESGGGRRSGGVGQVAPYPLRPTGLCHICREMLPCLSWPHPPQAVPYNV
jgi:hypothetical protein